MCIRDRSYFARGNSLSIHGKNNDLDKKHLLLNATVQLGKQNVENQEIQTSINDFNNMGFDFIRQFSTFFDLKGRNLYMKQVVKIVRTPDILQSMGFYAIYDKDQDKNIVVLCASENPHIQIGDSLISINGETPPKDNCKLYNYYQKYFGKQVTIQLERNDQILEVNLELSNENFTA